VKRIPSLDGLRAISISMVIIGHLAKSGHGPRIFWTTYAAVGVSIFFVISGYLITTILLREHEQTETISLKQFYVRRAHRIFPAALVFIILATLFYWHSMRWYHIAAALFYVANLDVHRPWIFGHLWSLSIEEQFYLLWPSVLKKWYAHRRAILVAVCLLAPLSQVGLILLKLRIGTPPTLPTVSDNLAAGCLLAVFFGRLPRVPIYAFCTMIVAVATIPLFQATTPSKTLFDLFVLRPIMYFSIAGIILHVVQHPYDYSTGAP
jgi:peptidoglycan/LPS O-acetylase OafA/YrhL